MPVSVFNLVDSALRKLGVVQMGEQGSPAMYEAGVANLRIMLEGWSLEALMVPYVSTEKFDLDPGQALYSIGIGGDWDTVRPEEVQAVRVLDDSGRARLVRPTSRGVLATRPSVDPGIPTRYVLSRDAQYLYVEFDKLPLALPHVLVTSRKPFNATALDNLTVVHDPAAPPWPIHPSGFSMAGIQTPIEFPTGYEGAIVYNLAVHLRPEYPGLELPAEVAALAASTKAVIKRSNWQPSILTADVGRMNRGGVFYDVVTGP